MWWQKEALKTVSTLHASKFSQHHAMPPLSTDGIPDFSSGSWNQNRACSGGSWATLLFQSQITSLCSSHPYISFPGIWPIKLSLPRLVRRASTVISYSVTQDLDDMIVSWHLWQSTLLNLANEQLCTHLKKRSFQADPVHGWCHFSSDFTLQDMPYAEWQTSSGVEPDSPEHCTASFGRIGRVPALTSTYVKLK